MPFPPHAKRGLVAAALLASFLAVLSWLDGHGLDPSPLRMSRTPLPTIYAITGACGVVCAFVPAYRRQILLAAALAAAPLIFGWWALAWLGYAAAVIAIARAVALPLAVRVSLAVLAWTALPVARILWLDGADQLNTIGLSILWAGQLYSGLYVVVEREREPVRVRPSLLADAFYLLALPRIVVPFFQPISPRLLASRERLELAWRRIAAAAGLAAIAVVAATLAWTLNGVAFKLEHWRRHWPDLGFDPWLIALILRFVHAYAHATYSIFTAITVFRLLGFDLPSGFRTPFLSRSFAEFFRRYNYYVRDAVLSLFYYPLLGRLRHVLPARAATIVAAYLGIIFGSFLLHDVLVPVATTIEPASTIGYYIDPIRVIAMVTFWSLIIIPTAGIGPRRRPERALPRWRSVLQIVAVNLIYFAIWYGQSVAHHRVNANHRPNRPASHARDMLP